MNFYERASISPGKDVLQQTHEWDADKVEVKGGSMRASMVDQMEAWCNPETAKAHGTACGRHMSNNDKTATKKNPSEKDKALSEAIGKGKEVTPHRFGRPIPIKVKNVMEAVKEIEKGHVVEMADAAQVHTLLDKIAYYNKSCSETKKECHNLDLCKVTVANTNLFCVGNKGIARIKMPQFAGTPVPGSAADKLPRSKFEADKVDATNSFIQHLKTRGIATQKVTVPAAWLRATQRELIGSKVAGIMTSPKAGEVMKAPIFISRDNYVVDGHHRWAAAVGKDTESGKLGKVKMHAIRIDAPISEILHISNKWTKQFGIQPEGFAPKDKSAKKAL